LHGRTPSIDEVPEEGRLLIMVTDAVPRERGGRCAWEACRGSAGTVEDRAWVSWTLSFLNNWERSLVPRQALVSLETKDERRANQSDAHRTRRNARIGVDAHPPMNGNSVPFPWVRPRTERTKKRACTQQIRDAWTRLSIKVILLIFLSRVHVPPSIDPPVALMDQQCGRDSRYLFSSDRPTRAQQIIRVRSSSACMSHENQNPPCIWDTRRKLESAFPMMNKTTLSS
jgi:hypothetical protein